MGSTTYSYAPNNQRVLKNSALTYYGATGQKLTTYSLSTSGGSLVATSTGTFYYFGGKLVKNAGGYVTPDRLGSNGKYFPYGQERPSATTNNKEKFATYYRDSETGNDYANNRYHQPGHGRFLTPDPAGSGSNFYAYAGGDPVNNSDPSGLYAIGEYNPDFPGCWWGYSDMTQDYGWVCGDTVNYVTSGDNLLNIWGMLDNYGGGVFAYDLGHVTPSNFLAFSTGYDVGGSGWAAPPTPPPASTAPLDHFVSISFWPDGAGGFGHIGIAVDSDDTRGFSTFDENMPLWRRILTFPDARLENDIAQHTNDAGVVQPHSYTHISVSAASAAAMLAYIESVRVDPGSYNLFFNNCAQFVEDVLHAGGVPGVPHNEVMFPGVLNRILD